MEQRERGNSRVGKIVLLGYNGCLRKISFHHNMGNSFSFFNRKISFHHNMGNSFSFFNRNGWMGLDCHNLLRFKMTTKK